MPPSPGETPMTSPTVILARRNTLRILRNPGAVVGGLVTPAVMFLAIWTVFGRAMDASGLDYAQYLTPGVCLQAVVFAAGGSAMAIGVDRSSGLLDRQRTLPISALAPIVGRLAADLLRCAASVAVVTALGVVFGFRFTGSVVDGVVYVLLVALFAMAIALLFDAIAVGAKTPESAAIVVQTATIPLILLSTAYAPSAAMPDWAAPVIGHLPVSAIGEALRDASAGSLDVGVVAEAGGWALLIGAVGLILGLRAFRRTR